LIENICQHETYQKTQFSINGVKALHPFHFSAVVVIDAVRETMKKTRSYWRNPSLTSELTRKEREKLTKKFMKLLEKDREKTDKWFSKVMKGKNRNLPHACGRDS